MMTTNELKVGDIVRPACDGESYKWTALRGRLIDVWQEGKEYRAEVYWFHNFGSTYARFMPLYLLVKVN